MARQLVDGWQLEKERKEKEEREQEELEAAKAKQAAAEKAKDIMNMIFDAQQQMGANGNEDEGKDQTADAEAEDASK
jgi:hypothetical protein